MEMIRLNIDNIQPEPPSEGEVRFQVAVLAALAGTAVALAARFLFEVPLVPELVAQFVFAVSPIWLVEMGVGLLGPFAKHLAFLTCLVVYAAALTAGGAALLGVGAQRGGRLWRRASPFLLSLMLWAVTMLAVIPLVGKGIFGRHLSRGAIFSSVALLIVYLVYGAALSFISALYIDRPGVARINNRLTRLLSRRRVIRGVGYAVLAVGLYDIGRSLFETWFQSSSGRVSGGTGVFPNIDGLASEVTAVKDFYQVSKNAFDPQVDAEGWRLEITGLVERPRSFTYAEIKSLPSVEQYATLECISNEVGGNLIGNALWRGLRLKDLLEKAGVKPGVVDLVLRASDDYTDSIPLDRGLADGTILAYEMNGEPLTATHGYPVRLIVPGIYGMKNVKWIIGIEAVNYDFKGYWQKRGWNDRAEYKTMSRIDVPDGGVREDTTIAGVAFAGDRGISKVEVSTDGGTTWEAAEIKGALSPFTWVLWHRLWKPDRRGKHSIRVRATDGRSVTQTIQSAPPAPDGASGYHVRVIDVD